MHLVLSRSADGVLATDVRVNRNGEPADRTASDAAEPGGTQSGATRRVADLAAELTSTDRERTRIVWDDTAAWYPELLEAGVRVARCTDLRLSRAILRSSELTAASALARAPSDWWDEPAPQQARDRGGLFELTPTAEAPDPFAEFLRQRDAVKGSGQAARLDRLLAAESAGALAAAEMKWTGLPWHRDRHEDLLANLLGPRPAADARPARMHDLLERIRSELAAPELNPDSAPDLLRALQRGGVRADSTRSSELQTIAHPVIDPLLEYKKLARLYAANGWHWLDQNVTEGRFRPDYVPGGVVTGRWGSRGGGGALQLPRQIRGAVVADPGWKLVVADAAQLEPRILTALAGDRAMAAAGDSGDLYAGIVASGAVGSRADAKVAMLGAMYGATSGDAGRLMPRLAKTYPRAIAFVEDAARVGERGGIVTTRLGRSSPAGDTAGYDETADQSRSRARAKARGRFTRNFVVQGTAAEWALCWLAVLRERLTALGGGAPLRESPHLVFFLHDELVVHSPERLAGEVERAARDAAAEAGRLLFGALPVRFPLTVATVDDYGQAK